MPFVRAEAVSENTVFDFRVHKRLRMLHSLDKESGLITLKVDKNRNGEGRTITIKADFEDGRFDVTDAPYITRRKDELAELEQIIREHTGIGQNAIWKASGIQRNRLQRLLSEGCGTLWHSVPGPNRSKLYHAGKVVQVIPSGTTASDTTVSATKSINPFAGDTQVVSGVGVVRVVRRTMGGTTVSPDDYGKNSS